MYEARLFGHQPPVKVTLDFEPSGGRTRVRLEYILVDYGVAVSATEWISVAPEMDRLTLRLHLPRHHLRELLDDIVDLPEVKKVREEDASPDAVRRTG
jgi:hypothetical protein